MRKVRLALALVVAASFASTNLLADTQDSHELDQTISLIYSGKPPQQGLLRLPAFSTEQLQEMQRDDDGDNIVEAPARGVEYFQVYAVGSSFIGWEYVDAAQFSTIYNHGGSLLRVAVLQYGYGNGGASLSGMSGTPYLTEALCGSMANLHYCNIGESVTGFIFYYSFDGAQGGNFSAFTHSIAYPWGTKTDSINIQ